MKTIAAITADFQRTFLGLPSRLAADMRGESVIRRTIKRLRAAKELASVHLLVPKSQEAAARSALGDLNVSIETHDATAPPWAAYVASGRKWSLDGWRGGLAGTTVYDEYHHAWLLDALARREQADAVLDVPAAAPLLDAELVDALVRHYAEVREEVRLGIMQTAPGLSAIIYHADLLPTLASGAVPPGRIMSYRPEDPRHDPILQKCLCATEAAISHACGRCIADTSTAIKRIERVLDELRGNDDTAGGPDAPAVSRWLQANRHAMLHPLPDEIEVEITTDDPLANSTLRPRGPALGRSDRMDAATFQRILDELAACDDRLLVLGGFGDPLLHEEFPAFVQQARLAGVLGVAVRTTGITLDDRAIEAMLAAEVDVLNITLDANTPETYRRVHHADTFERVMANIDRLCTVQKQRQCPRPLIVCEMMKTPATMDELEPFYDGWISRTGSAVLAGPSRYAGSWPDLAVMNMAPPSRFACSRLSHRAMILADGRMTLCDQDFTGKTAVGSIRQSRLADLWRSSALVDARTRHQAGQYDAVPLCRVCDEWHRP